MFGICSHVMLKQNIIISHLLHLFKSENNGFVNVELQVINKPINW